MGKDLPKCDFSDGFVQTDIKKKHILMFRRERVVMQYIYTFPFKNG